MRKVYLMKKQGTFLKIPYDWRLPTWKLIKEKMWNKEYPRIFTPKLFGWGYGINVYALVRDKRKLFIILVGIIFIVLDGLALDDITTNPQENYYAEYTIILVSVLITVVLLFWYKNGKD